MSVQNWQKRPGYDDAIYLIKSINKCFAYILMNKSFDASHSRSAETDFGK